jgi:protein-tyrosine sulfotransferase
METVLEIAPMLKHFGYDPNANPPVYGQPDSQVLKNTNDVIENESKWEEVGEIVKKISKKESAPGSD